ncbi:MAG TPA: neutral zinc metallopeptidase [Gemmataceae bacterium]|nr:neutral zinc metallopeptidase [Gemmataceae bacterium]
MRLDDVAESGNVEDRRGMGPGLAIGGGAGILLTILGLIFGVNLGGGGGGGQRAAGPVDEKTKTFAAKILKTTEDVWDAEFRKHDYGTYEKPKMVLFSDQVRTGCGTAPSAVGPFYCPADRTVYLDPTFFAELEEKLGGSKAEFSQGYVIAHEVGHHVQNLLGYNDMVERARRRGKQAGNDASVRLELMADYLAGVWAYHGQKMFNFIQPGDVDSAIKSAQAIGDDRLQKRAGGFVHPEQFTHGTSRQRVYFFQRGLKTGDASKDTLDKFFKARMGSNGEIEDF